MSMRAWSFSRRRVGPSVSAQRGFYASSPSSSAAARPSGVAGIESGPPGVAGFSSEESSTCCCSNGVVWSALILSLTRSNENRAMPATDRRIGLAFNAGCDEVRPNGQVTRRPIAPITATWHLPLKALIVVGFLVAETLGLLLLNGWLPAAIDRFNAFGAGLTLTALVLVYLWVAPIVRKGARSG